MNNKTTLGREKVSVIGLQSTNKKGTIMFSTPKRVRRFKKPVHTLEFEDINILEFTIKKLIELRAHMKKHGVPEYRTRQNVPQEDVATLLHTTGIEVHMINFGKEGEILFDGSKPEAEVLGKLTEMLGGAEEASLLMNSIKNLMRGSKPEQKAEPIKETVS